MARQDDYISDPAGITAHDLTSVMMPVADLRLIKVYVIDMATGNRTPILAAMLDTESDDAPNIYLYTEPA